MDDVVDKRKVLIAAMFLSIAGILFAGYLTFNKLILGVCSFGESCPYLWGYPVCIYGLILFTILLIAVIALLLKSKDKLANNMFFYASILGILFSGYYTYQEIFVITCPGGCRYSMGLPTCMYGFLVFLAVFVCARLYRKR